MFGLTYIKSHIVTTESENMYRDVTNIATKKLGRRFISDIRQVLILTDFRAV
jgi:hypothetical protein